MLYSLILSLYDWQGFGGDKVFIGVDNYIRLFQIAAFKKSLVNILIIQLMSIPPVLIIAIITSNLLFNLRKARDFFFKQLIFLPYIVTPVALGLIFNLLFSRSNGVVNHILESINLLPSDSINWLGEANLVRIVLAILIVWKYLGYHIVVYLSGISGISPELYEAAKVDGATGIQVFTKITVPLLKPITFFLILTDLIGGLQMFDEPFRLVFSQSSVASLGGPDMLY